MPLLSIFKFYQEMESSFDPNTQSPMPIRRPLNEPGGISSSRNEEDLHSILRMVQFNTNSTYSTNLGNSLSSRSAIGHSNSTHQSDVNLQNHGNTCMVPYISLPSYKMALSSFNPAFSQSREYSHQTKVQIFDVNQEKSSKQQEIIQKEVPEYPAQQQIRSCLQEQVNHQSIFAPLLEGGLCSRRFKQYLYHLRNDKHENDVFYWKKFVSEYFATGSKMRWCFSQYENIELHTAGLFCPKSMVTWSCQLCGLRSGQALEATFETFPRLFKIKLESGMLDELLYLDSPRSRTVSHGVVLEYGKVIQEHVYDTFRVVRNGKLQIVFGHDMKIKTWEFCIENHDEYLLRTLFSPQINLLDTAVEKYQDIQNSKISSGAKLQELHQVCNMFVSAGTQIEERVELPLLMDLGYPKRFIRCLQIGEVAGSMRDLMTFCRNGKVGPIGKKVFSRRTMIKVFDRSSKESCCRESSINVAPAPLNHQRMLFLSRPNATKTYTQSRT